MSKNQAAQKEFDTTEEKKPKPIIHSSFNSFTVDLTGSNLIEASAGTGKTYSMAVLALRLILEKEITIDQILMVTFTKDATAEMKLRVRQFIREALQAAREIKTGQQIFEGLDKQIVSLVRRQANTEAAIQRLQDALVQFDKAAIFTIHGFCARILGEYAFDSGKMFKAKTLDPADFNIYIEDAFNDCWRSEVTILDVSLLELCYRFGFEKSRVFSLVKDAVAGKKIYLSNLLPGESYRAHLSRIIVQINTLTEPNTDTMEMYAASEKMYQSILADIINHKEAWVETALSHTKKDVREKIPDLLSKPEVVIFKEFKKSTRPAYISNILPEDFKDKIEQLKTIEKEIKKTEGEQNQFIADAKNLIPALISILAKIIYLDLETRLTEIKETAGEATYDDLITGLHEVTCCTDHTRRDQSVNLIQVLQKKYKAVFIDEFQDTDRQQFEIFQTVFGVSRAHLLFYIGDPKQSIYAFRKADLETYFQAAELVDHVWRMNTNYRSTADYVEAMNEFFQPTANLEVFKSKKMTYHKVDTPSDARTGYLEYENNPLNPLRIICCGNKASIASRTVQLVMQLLHNPAFKIKIKNNSPCSIQAGQIGILIRNKSEGKALQERLSKMGIAAITISDTKIFETPEAIDLYYVLIGVDEVQKGSVNRALLTKIAGISFVKLNQLDTEKLVQQFRGYQDEWKSHGIYSMLRHFLSDVKAIQRKQEGKLENADRVLSNTIQLMEMLHEAESENKYNPEELISWLKKGIDGEKFSEDEYLQRIESDDAAVKIVTMHSCKGLEYDVVIAPYLDMTNSTKKNTKQLRMQDGYYVAEKQILTKADDDEAKEQTDQENLRLLYVAMTRARYHCYVMSGSSIEGSKNIQTSLSHLRTLILENAGAIKRIRFLGEENTKSAIKNCALFENNPPPELGVFTGRKKQTEKTIQLFAQLPSIHLPDKYWQKTSYSKLNIKQDLLLLTHADPSEDAYDQFVFKKMRKGAQTGNFLHDVFEHMDFTNPDSWKYPIRAALNRYPGTGVKMDDHHQQMHQLLEHVTDALLPAGNHPSFSLHTIPRASRLNELEFDLPLSTIDWKIVPKMLDGNNIPIRINREATITGGILNGKVDLFFEKDGQYYILDWKSNHLGNRPEDYTVNAMATAMEENNYYLQYYLYCLALYRYLQTRISNFDYEKQFGGVYYLFVRGMRKEHANGDEKNQKNFAEFNQIDL